MPMAVVNPLINFGDAHPDLDTIGGNQYQQPQQRRRRHAHGGGGRSAIDSRQAKRRYEPAPSLSPGDFLPSDAPLRGAHEAPLLGISETGPVSSCLVNHQQWPDNINKAAAAGVFAPLGTSGSGSHDSASSRPRTQSCRKEKQRQQQQPSRAESIIRDFKRLYEFGVDVGVLPEDHDMAAGLGRMEAHFRSLSRRATDGGDGGSSPVQGHWDSDSDASSASGLGSGVSGAEGLEEDF
ncbi:hypothetical protein NKR23_g2045 [Pleurostoma richardsiae]|uniref:Uncharacterized protein n=1 Tax=Pleurostoma richardsiae TaxID=41990 RepID=A0AA38RQ53_9PEZI|nr:hypothetical protein NKR23_g2045 [Pleurostoma richardsiae]